MNVAIIVFQRSKPNESKSWSRDGGDVIGVSNIDGKDELMRLWFDIFILVKKLKK